MTNVSNNGTLAGQYTITAVEQTDTRAANNGTVYVNSYFDKGSNQSFVPLNNSAAWNKISCRAGTNYLGSENGYIINNTTPKHYFADTSEVL